MSDNLAYVLTIFIFFGWIPILSFGKAISWIVDSVKPNKEEDIEDEVSREEIETRFTSSGDNPRPARN